ncbi:hypothetical protein GE09DRAFT_1249686 [Coniochaeta sp. 2T2.1]|nr:hypothetical protein GE09DRAFT_1249686 [Coniochaeta sp. 2T2.1]
MACTRPTQPQLILEGGDEVERLRVRAAARRLLARVESPYERVWGFCFEQPVVFAALQTIDLGLWRAWTAEGGGEKTIDQLVKLTTRPSEVEPELLRRFCRLLAAFNVVEETGEDTFQPIPFSLAIGNESTKYLATIGYKVSTEVGINNHSGSDADGLNFFGRLQASPKCYADFNGHGALQELYHVHPVVDRLLRQCRLVVGYWTPVFVQGTPLGRI